MSSSTSLPGKGAMYEDQYGRTWFVAAGDDVPEEWTKVRESAPLPGEQLDPNNIDGTVRRDEAVVQNEELLVRLAELEDRLAAVEPSDDAPSGDDPAKTTPTPAAKPAVTTAKANPAAKG